MGFKLQACKDAQDTTGNGTPRKYIVCNADEGDPAAFSDRYLLEQRPHRVLLGMMIAGYCVGADTGVLYIRAEYPEAVDIVKQAVADIEAKGWIGRNIKGSGFNYRFKVIKAAGAYVCGEETALLNSIEGKRERYARARLSRATRSLQPSYGGEQCGDAGLCTLGGGTWWSGLHQAGYREEQWDQIGFPRQRIQPAWSL
ncbi:MAG: hypothetical protein IPG92_03990 [Flavobacteriales bacterium]|nr:hypothetical protein [Flavobacteriales bacterium]